MRRVVNAVLLSILLLARPEAALGFLHAGRSPAAAPVLRVSKYPLRLAACRRPLRLLSDTFVCVRSGQRADDHTPSVGGSNRV